MRSEIFYVNEKSTDTSWDRTSDLPICSTAPLPLCHSGPLVSGKYVTKCMNKYGRPDRAFAVLKRCSPNILATVSQSGFGGLEVACWPLVPKFAGLNPAEAVGFFRAKKSSVRLP